jgi:hypothetical protein
MVTKGLEASLCPYRELMHRCKINSIFVVNIRVPIGAACLDTCSRARDESPARVRAYVPTKVRNVIYLKNRETKRITEMEMNVRWVLGKCNVDDFTLDSASKVIDNTGPFGVLKKELLGQRVEEKRKKEQSARW